jgi:cytochrome c-type biogenesis protein CcmF
MVLAVALGTRGVGTVLIFGLGAFAAGSAVRQLVLAARRQGWRGLVGRANGGMIVHVGVVVIAVAIATNGHFAHEVEARYEPGQTRVVSGREITYLDTSVVQERNREATKVRVQVDGGQVYEPALSRYPGFGRLIGTPSVKTGLLEDVYLTVTRLPDEGSDVVTLRVIIQPMALWLWVGGGIMALGTVLAAWPGRRRRRPTDPVSAQVPLDDEDLVAPVPVGAR